MTPQTRISNDELAAAFQTFSQLSVDLVDTYKGLEDQVSVLSDELARAEADKHRELLEKERLANRLGLLLDSLPAGVVVLDAQGIVSDSNPAARELLGEPLDGVAWRDIITRAFAPRPDDGHDMSLANGRRVNISTCSLGAEPGQIILVKNVTETRQLQDKVAHMQRLSAMGEMAASLAHQVRTPLASALLYAGGLSREKLPEDDRKRFSGRLRGVLIRLEDLVRDMLSFARTGSMQLEPLPVSVLIDSLRDQLQATRQKHDFEYQLQCQLFDQHLLGNQAALLSAIQNLVNNAIQVTDHELQLTISCEPGSDRCLQLRIADNGPGIPAELRQRIFHPFVSAREGGTGLGLAVVQSIIDAHGGSITLAAPSTGTEFVITLPLATLAATGEQ